MSAHRMPRGRCGRADLLRMLAATRDQPAARIAPLVGYRWDESAAQTKPAPPGTGGEPDTSATTITEPSTPPRIGQRDVAAATFWQATRLTGRAPRQRETRPEPRAEREPPSWTNKPTGTPALHPLAAWSDLRQRLRPRLSELCDGAEPDLERTVARIARGRLLERLPRRRQRRLASCVQLLFDRSERLVPYWSDQDQVAAELARLLPRGAVERAVYHEGCAGPRLLDRQAAYSPPPAGGVVLVLGDLGSLGADAETARWQRLGREVIASGSHAAALVPCRADQVPAALQRSWQVVPWERPLSIATAESAAYDRSPAARSQRAQRLLTLLAPALRIEPGLLRAIRLAIADAGYDAALEAEVWQHPAIASTHCEAATLNQDQRRTLLRAFAAQPEPERRRALALLRCWRGHLPPEIWFEELLNLAADFDADLPEPNDLADARGFFAYVCEMVEPEPLAPTPIGAWVRRVGQRATGLFDDREIGQRLQDLDWQLHRRDTRYLPPRPADPIDFPAPSDEQHHYALAQWGEALVLQPQVQRDPPASPLGGIASSNGLLQIGISDGAEAAAAFWESGQPPSWAARWGWDEYGAWVEFELAPSGAEPVAQRMRWIEPGTFLMGSPEGEEGRWEAEGPQHQVQIAEGYWLFDTACTQALWKIVMPDHPSRFKFKGSTRPVVRVSWDDLQRFVVALNARVPGLNVRLPSEAQWEYACRAGSTSRWCFGDKESQLTEYAWYSRNAGGRTHSVGQKRPNAWGLFDCHGNVFEWVQDAWHERYGGAPIDGAPWESAEAVGDRVIRGGSWDRSAQSCRSAYRNRQDSAFRSSNLGFRCVRLQLQECASGPRRDERSDRPRPDLAHGNASGVIASGAHLGGSSGAAPGAADDRTDATAVPGGTTLRLGPAVAVRVGLPDTEVLTLRTDRDELTLRRLPKPGWAHSIGRDRYGLWAEIRIEAPGAPPAVQRLRWIAPGRFQMGSHEQEPGRLGQEGPPHPVFIGQGFWLFDTPCTQALWAAVMVKNPSHFRDPQRPVERVSWNDAQGFAEALQDRLPAIDDDGGRIVLPTEAQWEYACRAGTDTAVYTGPMEIRGDVNQSMDAPALDPIAWYGGNSGVGYDLDEGEDTTTGWWEAMQKQYSHTRAGTRRVKQKQPNAWGLYDMLGNVWEWTEDHWHDNYDNAPNDGRGWIDSDTDEGADRVFRGGSWLGGAQGCRSAYRSAWHPRHRNKNLGFRCACIYRAGFGRVR